MTRSSHNPSTRHAGYGGDAPPSARPGAHAAHCGACVRPPQRVAVACHPALTLPGSVNPSMTQDEIMAHHKGGLAPAPARRGASGPRRALLPRRHIAVVHFADLPPLHQAMKRTGNRPLGEASGLAHLSRPEPLRPRGRKGC
jgi:hypothetical protein